MRVGAQIKNRLASFLFLALNCSTALCLSLTKMENKFTSTQISKTRLTGHFFLVAGGLGEREHLLIL